ncbi:MAG: transcription elongation factor Spt4 [Thaumarchaeota archaeon]|nr:transcription elongation factor Spt4 [Nitrososphaerota archaeon]
MAKELACRKCKALTIGRVCPVCHSTELSQNWLGLVIILDTEKSQVAQTITATKPARYALRVN